MKLIDYYNEEKEKKIEEIKEVWRDEEFQNTIKYYIRELARTEKKLISFSTSGYSIYNNELNVRILNELFNDEDFVFKISNGGNNKTILLVKVEK